MSNPKRVQLAILASLGAAVGTLSCASTPTTTASSGTVAPTTRLENTVVESNKILTFTLPQDARSAIVTRVNSEGFSGVVEEIGKPAVPQPSPEAIKKSGLNPADPLLLSIVSTPVSVRVKTSHFGTVVAGDVVILRILGGDSGAAKTESDASKALEKLAVGSNISAFSGYGVVYADGSTMYTPNQIFVQDGDSFSAAFSETGVTTTEAEIEALVAERKAIADKAKEATKAGS